jgi:serine/threonine protein kinase
MVMQRREIEALKICQHPNLIQFQDLFETNTHYYLVIEHLDGGDLYDYLEKRNFKISDSRARELFAELTSALFYLHCFGIVHRDIKLENILMTDSTEQSITKVNDFGLAAILGPHQTANEKVGSLNYAAPELLKGKDYDKSVDVWSMGIVFFTLLAGYLPFQGRSQDETKRRIKEGQPDRDEVIWKKIPKEADEICFSMLDKNPETRIKLETILQHQWVLNSDAKKYRR